MSKQYNKLIKRRRRAAYLARRKKALAEAIPQKPTTKSKTPRKATKSVPKPPAPKQEPTSAVAEVKASEKATATDVLGPDADTESTPPQAPPSDKKTESSS